MLGWFKRKLKSTGSVEELGPVSLVKDDAPEQTDEATIPVAADSPKSGQAFGLTGRLKASLAKTRESFTARVDQLLLSSKKIDESLLDDLEEILITADLGVATTTDLLEKARKQVRRQELKNPAALKKVLRESILEYLRCPDKAKDMAMPASGPFVIMAVGVNGVGKTTTVGKIAHKFVQAGQKVLLVPGDTFRAAAIDQLKVWGERSNVEVLASQTGADPSSVVYDAMEHAVAKGHDVVLVDTAGRLHTRVNLMEELKKIQRVIAKRLPGAPHEILLVLDATTGQNGISQMRLFHEAVGVTGLALTKLDGTARGGIVVSLCHEFNVPIRFIGIGEQTEDLRDFDPEEFTEALFAGNGS